MKIQNKKFELLTSFKAKENDDGSVTIRGMASTTDVDRAGDVIVSDAWKKGGLENFKKNPIILFNHDYDEPIGKAVEINVLEKGLEIVVKVSSAAQKYAGLIKDGVLGAFSVGFMIKDADWSDTTGGLLIKDVELLEVSVVSVPCNQAAVFQLSKSFDSTDAYEDFIKTFKNNSVDLAGQSLAKGEVNTSDIASNTPASGADASQQEIEMTKEELQAYAKQVAEETAARIKADNEAAAKVAKDAADAVAAAAAAKTAQEEAVKSAVTVAVKSGAEAVVADFQKALAEKDANMAEVIKQFQADLTAHKEEITAMRTSKMQFTDRGVTKGDLSPWAKDFLAAKMIGVITGKGFNTNFGAQLFQKAGVDYTTAAADIDQTVSRTIEQEIRLELRAANLFREIPVISGATVLPIQPDSEKATFQKTGAPEGNLEKRGDSDNTFDVQQVILNAYRLISSTYIDNDTDEQILVNLMPMLIDAVARAHARAVDNAVINGVGSITGLAGYSALSSTTLDISDAAKLTAAKLMAARGAMGKYGINPRDVGYIVSMAGYYDLLNDAEFQNIDEVGSDVAMKVVGTVGAVYGSPVIVSDNFPAVANDAMAAVAANVRSYVIPRLRGVNLESDYEVGNQRRIIVASQSLGFQELVAGDGAGNEPSVRIKYVS